MEDLLFDCSLFSPAEEHKYTQLAKKENGLNLRRCLMMSLGRLQVKNSCCSPRVASKS